MNIRNDIWKWLLPVWLLLSSCVYEDIDCPAPEVIPSNPYLVIRLSVPSETTRSNPAGGEEGDGREPAFENEEYIHDLNVFFYNHEDGLDAPEGTPVFFHIYYNRDDIDDVNNTDLEVNPAHDGNNLNCSPDYLEIRFNIPAKYKEQLVDGVMFAVVANVGYIGNVSNLGQLRNIPDLATRVNPKAALGNKADNMKYFPMSTAYNQEYVYGGKRTGNNTIRLVSDHLEGVTTIERLYARIDLWYDSDILSDDSQCLVYDVVDGENNTATGNKLYIANVLPVNVMQSPSFLFKKVTDFGDGWDKWEKEDFEGMSSFKWAGRETPDLNSVAGSDRPSNYVMEPHTLDKSVGGDTPVQTLDSWYGSTAAYNVKSNIAVAANGRLTSYFAPVNTFSGENGCDRVFIIGYANENTHPIDCFNSNYLTGLACRGFYVPLHIYSSYDKTAGLTELTDKTKKPAEGKIYRYSPSTGEAGKTPSEDFSLYFSSKVAADAYMNANPSESGSLTVFDADVSDSYGLGFACYYNLWLRHYNDADGDQKVPSPMEYAIVRNNIYRVAMSFTGPGDPEPTMREPDTMKARIFVRKWNLRLETNDLEF